MLREYDLYMARNNIRAVGLVLSGLLVLAVLPLASGYYVLLRFVVTFGAGYLAYYFFNNGDQKWIVFTFIALLWNPLAPIYLDKEVWVILDIIGAITIAVLAKPKDAIIDAVERKKHGDI
jgi:hypothetical protein